MDSNTDNIYIASSIFLFSTNNITARSADVNGSLEEDGILHARRMAGYLAIQEKLSWWFKYLEFVCQI